jgi:hypothetical protein
MKSKQRKVIKGRVTIGMVHSSNTPDYVEIRFVDDASSVEFASARFTLEDFAKVITGLGFVDSDIEVGGLDKVGKTMEHDVVEFPFQSDDYKNRDKLAAKEAKKYVPEGWVSDDYFGSQGSFFQRDGKGWARVTVRRWVEV